MVQILDALVLQTVQQLAEILKLMDTQSLVEQVLSALFAAGSAAGGAARGCASALLLQCAHAPAEIEEEFLALARDATGRTWFHVRGPRGLLVAVGLAPRPGAPTGGDHRQPKAVCKYWHPGGG